MVKHLDKEIPVIEVNLETSIDRGNNIQVLEKSEIALPALFNEYYRLRNVKVAKAAPSGQKMPAAAASPAQNLKRPAVAKGKKPSVSPKR